MLSSPPQFQQLHLSAERDGGLWLHRGTTGACHHRHDELEINLCVSGHAHYLVGERRFHLSRRSLLWLFPAQNHLLLDASPDFAMWVVVWKPTLLEAVCRAETSRELKQFQPAQTWFSPVRSDDAARLESLFALVRATEGDDHFNAGLSFALMECQRASDRSEESIAGRVVHPCVEEAARLLRDDALDVPTLARRVGLSPNRLSRLFREQIGVTMTEFRTKMALERFTRIYDGRGCSLTQAAIEAGFGSYAQFHRAFVRQNDCNPAQFREQLRTSNQTVLAGE